jgi:3-hydroxy-3-methylglutaryl CoA synthase
MGPDGQALAALFLLVAGGGFPNKGDPVQRHTAITGWGSYVPERIVTNQDLEALVDTSDEWIRTRTGICQRHIAGPGETTSSMCVKAAERALACARLSAADVDLVICATTTRLRNICELVGKPWSSRIVGASFGPASR